MEPQTQPAQRDELRLPGALRAVATIGSLPEDDEVVRPVKALFAIGHLLIALPAAIIYPIVFWAVGLPAAAASVLVFGAGMVLSVVALARWPDRFGIAASISATTLLTLCVLRPLALGAYPNYATSTLWGILAIATVLVIIPRTLPVWVTAYAAIVVVVVTVIPIVHPDSDVPAFLHAVLAVVDILLAAAIALALIAIALRGRQLQQERADGLLDAILPREIARILKRGPSVIARRFETASILFADVVGFTPLSSGLPPEELVGMLDEVFSDFDAVVERAGLEKIKTVGDTYMVAAGVPEPRPDHAQALVGVALELRAIAGTRAYRGHRLVFRFGINSGPVVAGVIGRRKFAYDLWGDAVNIASRMESHGVGGEIHITDTTRSLLDGRFQVEPIGAIDLKGRGPVEAWRVVGVGPA